MAFVDTAVVMAFFGARSGRNESKIGIAEPHGGIGVIGVLVFWW